MPPSVFSIHGCWRMAAGRPRRWAVVVTLVMLGCIGPAVADQLEQAQEPVGSGEAVVGPATSIFKATPPDPALRDLLHQVLEHAHPPILRAPAPPRSQPPASPLVVERPNAVVDGWRATDLKASPPSGSPSQPAKPQISSTDWPASQLPAKEGVESTPSESRRIEVEVVDLHKNEVSTEVIKAKPADVNAPQPGYILRFRTPPADDTAARPAPSTASAELTCSGEPTFEAAPTDEAPTQLPDITPIIDDSPPDESSSVGDGALESPAEADDELTTETATDVAPPLPQARTADKSTARSTVESDMAAADAEPAPQLPLVKSPPPPLTRQLMNLRARIRGVLKGYYRKPLNSRDHDTWEVMHGMLAYGIHSRILQNSPSGQPITAVGWLCYNQPCKRLTLMYVTPEGELRAKHGVGLQGHMGQFLAMLAQCNVSPDYPIHVGQDKFTIRDLIESEKKTCYPKTELTFKLIALQHYLDLNEKWVNDQGLEWDIPRLIREEMAQPIRGAACGGTHRLSGLSLTVKARQRRGEPLNGEYARAAKFVQEYHNYAFRLQNSDGSLSTEWFRGRGDEDDDDRRIKTTGHILEWLCYSLSDEELRQPRTMRAVSYLANLMSSEYDHEWEIGPRSHAIHALLIYDERVFRPFDNDPSMVSFKPQPATANRSQRSTTSRR